MRISTMRATFMLLVGLGSGLAFAQSVDLPYRNDVLEGVTTAGQPSAEALAAVAAAGYKSVIDLRGPTEDRGFDEQGTVEKLGMSYVSLPVEGAAGVTYANADALDRLLADLPKPVLLHCSTSNRVGALLALRAKQDGAGSEAALDFGTKNGLVSLKPAVEQKLAEGHD
jgi:protein tyrosine phosphatase (PTP) superfamily phosphohydrolase (DUF442 family)